MILQINKISHFCILDVWKTVIQGVIYIVILRFWLKIIVLFFTYFSAHGIDAYQYPHKKKEKLSVSLQHAQQIFVYLFAVKLVNDLNA